MIVRFILCLAAMLSAAVGSAADAPDRDQAYALNRDGMIAMSEARFQEAIMAFEQASALVPDYGIRGRALLYTPIFMTGWASEKIGGMPKACETYRRFLAVAPADAVEPTKAEHATSYLAAHCSAASPKPSG